MTEAHSLETLVAPLHTEAPFDPAAWAHVWPGLAAVTPSLVREASLTSIARRLQKALLVLRVDAHPTRLAEQLLPGGLDLRRGHASRGDDDFVLEAVGKGTRMEAHLLLAPMAPEARVDAVTRGVGLGAELVELAVQGTLVEVGLTRGEGRWAALTVHLASPFEAEQRLIAAGFVETDVRGVPALTRAAETVLLAGGTWYAYVGGLPAELPIQADD